MISRKIVASPDQEFLIDKIGLIANEPFSSGDPVAEQEKFRLKSRCVSLSE